MRQTIFNQGTSVQWTLSNMMEVLFFVDEARLQVRMKGKDGRSLSHRQANELWPSEEKIIQFQWLYQDHHLSSLKLRISRLMWMNMATFWINSSIILG